MEIVKQGAKGDGTKGTAWPRVGMEVSSGWELGCAYTDKNWVPKAKEKVFAVGLRA